MSHKHVNINIKNLRNPVTKYSQATIATSILEDWLLSPKAVLADKLTFTIVGHPPPKDFIVKKQQGGS